MAAPITPDLTTPNAPDLGAGKIPKKLVLWGAVALATVMAIAMTISETKKEMKATAKKEDVKKTAIAPREYETGRGAYASVQAEQARAQTDITKKLEQGGILASSQATEAQASSPSAVQAGSAEATVGAGPRVIAAPGTQYVTAIDLPDMAVRVPTGKPVTGQLPSPPPLPQHLPPEGKGVEAIEAEERLAARTQAASAKMLVFTGGEGKLTASVQGGNSGDQSADALMQRAAAEMASMEDRKRMEVANAVPPELLAVKGSAATPPMATPGERAAQWLEKRQGVDGGGNANVLRLQAASGQFVVSEGSVIPAVLLSELNSDMPGLITALVQTDILDSIGGSRVLIPRGSRLVGAYGSGASVDQEKVMAVFTRLIYPDGRYINLGSMQAADAIGQSGMPGEVNNHFWKMFGSSFLVAGITKLVAPTQNVSISITGGSMGSSGAVGEILTDISKKILERNSNIQPTVIVPRGQKFNVMVSKDMALPPLSR